MTALRRLGKPPPNWSRIHPCARSARGSITPTSPMTKSHGGVRYVAASRSGDRVATDAGERSRAKKRLAAAKIEPCTVGSAGGGRSAVAAIAKPAHSIHSHR